MAEKIQEFLADLGFQVDESGLRKFEGALGRTIKGVLAMGAAVAAAVATVIAGVQRIASTYESLFYLAQRSGTTVTNIKTLGYAFEQIGLSASEASSAIEGVAMAVRTNPGYEGLLRGLGVTTRDANNQLRDTNQIAGDLIERLAKMPFFVAAQYAAMFGISARTLLQLEQNLARLRESEAEYRATAVAAGLDLDQLAVRSRDFMVELRRVWLDVRVVFERIAQDNLPAIIDALREADKYIRAHFGDLEQFEKSLRTAVTDTVSDLKDVAKTVNDIVIATIGWQKTLEAVAAIILYRIFGPVSLIFLAIQKGREFWDKVQKDNKKFDEANPGYMKRDERGNLYEPGWSFEDLFKKRESKGLKKDERGNLYEPGWSFEDLFKSWSFENLFKKRESEGLKKDERGNLYEPGGSLQDLLHKQSYHPDDAASSRELTSVSLRLINSFELLYDLLRAFLFGSPGASIQSHQLDDVDRASFRPANQPTIHGDFDDIEASYGLPKGVLDRVWEAESGRGQHMRSSAGALGHFQFMPGTAREYGLVNPNDLTQSANAAAHYISDLLRRYSGNLAKALAAYNWGPGNLDRDIQRNGKRWQDFLPAETQGYLDRIFQGHPLVGAGARDRGDTTLHQQTTINVTGGESGVRTASAIAAAQRRVNADLVRNFNGALLA